MTYQKNYSRGGGVRMKSDLFYDIPGVGEVLIYRRNKLSGEENLWLDDLAFETMAKGAPMSFHEFERLCGSDAKNRTLDMPFLKIQDRHVSFASEKYLVAAILLAVYDALEQKRDLEKLVSLMPYDHINYFRPVIEADDHKILTKAIENSINKHYKRFLLLLLRRCGVEGEKSWGNWIKEYITKFPTEITSYPEFTVQRDAFVTYTSIAGHEVLYPFVDRMMADTQLQEYERRHFIESLGTGQRAGEVLYWKIIEAGYRQDIAPINIYSIHFFPSHHIKQLLENISEKHKIEKIRSYAKIALELCE
jgi:hypothetical protein